MKRLKSKIKSPPIIIFGLSVLTVSLPLMNNRVLSSKTDPRRKPTIDRSLITREKQYQALVEKANQKGSVKIIVNLKDDYRIEGDLQEEERVNQRQRIQSSQDTILERIEERNFSGVKKFQFTPGMAITVDAQTLEFLNSLPEVQSIQEDIPIPPTLDSSIPVINADDAWDAGYTGSGQVVAILDTGVDSDHEFLTGKVVSEACYSSNDAGYNSSTVCPNAQESQTGTGAGVNCSTAIEGCSHGTHVAGIAAGSGAGFSGVAKEADLIAVQVFSRFDDTGGITTCADLGYSSPCALTYTSDQILGLERVYAIRGSYTIASVNMSLGGGGYDAYCDSDSRKTAIDNLRSAGIATAIASGNSYYWGAIGAPACISTCVSVGASTDGDDFAIYSNIDEILDMVAPGSGITSSIPDDNYDTWNGTSMATPHVAGAFAVIRSKNSAATVTEIEDALKDTGTTITETWFSVTISKPRIDVNAALGQFSDDGLYRFIVQDSGASNVATVDNSGNTVLAGTCTVGTCTAPSNSFIVKNSSGDTVGYIDSSGNLCISMGDCSDESANCDSPTGDAFVVKDNSNNNVFYIDQNGDLCLIGTLTESGSP